MGRTSRVVRLGSCTSREHVLDNPIWHSLNGPHARFAIGRKLARHYPREILAFSALAEDTAEAYRELALDLPEGAPARLFQPAEGSVPNGWERLSAVWLKQMVAVRAVEAASPHSTGLVELTPDDMADMLALIEVAQPGPSFTTGVLSLGRYLGVRQNGRLIAMGGERLRPSGYVELTAICVHPEHRGRGYATEVSHALMDRIVSNGLIPFLHTHTENEPAVALYTKLGFEIRREMVTIVQRPSNVQ